MFSSAIERLNEKRSGAGEIGEDAGFTLIELMVVLLILAILLAIAIPTFLGVTGGANDRAAQSNLNTALTTAKTQETQNNQSYAAETAGNLTGAEPSLNCDCRPDDCGQGDVSVWVVPSMAIASCWRRISKSGNCWYAVDNIGAVATRPPDSVSGCGYTAPPAAGTYYGKSTNASACDAAAALPALLHGPPASAWCLIRKLLLVDSVISDGRQLGSSRRSAPPSGGGALSVFHSSFAGQVIGSSSRTPLGLRKE